MRKRFPLIDQIRGFAIVLMIIFHFFYDLKIFGYNNINFSKDFFWYELPRVIVFLFMLAMGLSMPLIHSEKVNWKKFWPRWIKIALGALVISIYTYFMFKSAWIYFGTLHCIALASLVSLPFINITCCKILHHIFEFKIKSYRNIISMNATYFLRSEIKIP